MRKGKQILSVILVLNILMITFMVFGVSTVSADSANEKLFTGKQATKDSYAAATIDYILAKYKNYSKYPDDGECWGYAEKANSLLSAENKTTYYNKGKKFNVKNVRELLKGCKAGTHLRLGYQKKFDGWHGHSVVLYKCTEDLVLWGQNNYTPGTVTYHVDTLESFVDWLSQYPYINMVKEVTKYKHYSTPMIASQAADGGIELVWTKASGATKYYVYRSSEKNGTYKKIATVKNPAVSYTDYSGALGKKQYYKIKAIRTKGNTYSDVANGKRKLKEVSGIKNSYQANTGKIMISWDSVPEATSYKIYRFNTDTWKYDLIKTTTGLSYVDSGAKTPGRVYDYLIKAYSSKAKVYSPEANFWVVRGVERPTELIAEYDTAPVISWKAVDNAEGYHIYRSTSKNGTYQQVGEAYGFENSFIDEDQLIPGKTYYYKIKSYVGYWGFNDYEIIESSYSARTSVTIPEETDETDSPIDSDYDADDYFDWDE